MKLNAVCPACESLCLIPRIHQVRLEKERNRDRETERGGDREKKRRGGRMEGKKGETKKL